MPFEGFKKEEMVAAPRRPSLPAGRVPNRPYTLSPEDAGWLIEDVWPTVYFGSERLEEIKRKVATLPWAKKAWDLMRREAEMACALPPQVPMEQCGWRHDFYSRHTATPLLYEPDQPDRFLDPSTGKREADKAQRQAWALLTHERTFRMMRSLGILYRLTGDEKYAAWAAEGMRRAAAYFTHHEFQRPGSPVAALYYQPLYDAGMVLLLANAYDLSRSSKAYSDADHAAIQRNIFEDRVPPLMTFLEKGPQLHNMACFASAAVASAGRLYNRKDWLEKGLDARTGLRAQLMGGIPTTKDGSFDGFWREGTLFYHFYSLCTLTTLFELEKMAHGQIDADLRRRFASMFAAPLALLDSQLRLPPVGDLSAPRTVGLSVYRHLYEYAAGQLDANQFGPPLAALYESQKMPRTDLTALAFGPDDLPRPGGIPTESTVLPVAGMGVFRANTPAPFWCLFRCGPNHKGHDHPDRLSILLTAHGQLISPDLGDAGYSLHSLNGTYFRNTIAHNTLFVDEKSQTGDASLNWRPDAAIPQARGVIVDDGVTFTRTVFFDAPYVVLIDEYAADKPRRFGWVYHAYGDVTGEFLTQAAASLLPAMPPLPTKSGWENLEKRRTGAIADGGKLAASWIVAPGLNLRAVIRSDAAFEATTARTPGQPYADRQGAVLLRAPGTQRRFYTILEVHQGGPPSLADLAAASDNSVTATLRNGQKKTYRWG